MDEYFNYLKSGRKISYEEWIERRKPKSVIEMVHEHHKKNTLIVPITYFAFFMEGCTAIYLLTFDIVMGKIIGASILIMLVVLLWVYRRSLR